MYGCGKNQRAGEGGGPAGLARVEVRPAAAAREPDHGVRGAALLPGFDGARRLPEISARPRVCRDLRTGADARYGALLDAAGGGGAPGGSTCSPSADSESDGTALRSAEEDRGV